MPELPIALVAWYACGVAGFLYWWADDAAPRRGLVRDALLSGVLGPVTVLAGLAIRHLFRPDLFGPDGDEDRLRPIRVRIDDDRRRARRSRYE